MEHQQTQKKIIVTRLLDKGVVDNVWAFRNRILRLGAIIHTLRSEGWEIDTEYKNLKGQRNCHYYLIKKPKNLCSKKQ